MSATTVPSRGSVRSPLTSIHSIHFVPRHWSLIIVLVSLVPQCRTTFIFCHVLDPNLPFLINTTLLFPSFSLKSFFSHRPHTISPCPSYIHLNSKVKLKIPSITVVMKVLTLLSNLSLAAAVACPFGQLKEGTRLETFASFKTLYQSFRGCLQVVHIGTSLQSSCCTRTLMLTPIMNSRSTQRT